MARLHPQRVVARRPSLASREVVLLLPPLYQHLF